MPDCLAERGGFETAVPVTGTQGSVVSSLLAVRHRNLPSRLYLWVHLCRACSRVPTECPL
jgi:hypothetical protein